jgi:hypothetical protein
MHKAEIIGRILSDLPNGEDGGVACSEAYRARVTESLHERLPEGQIQTCDDVKDMSVECCSSCHEVDSEHLFLETLPGGQVAWICCAVHRKLFLERAAADDSANLASRNGFPVVMGRMHQEYVAPRNEMNEPAN